MKVLTLVFWAVIPRGLVRRNHHLRKYIAQVTAALKMEALISSKTGNYQQVYMVLQPRRPTLTSSPT
jgi:hypothetical protein